MKELAEHGVSLPPNMQGLTDDQITDLKLVDEWGEKCIPSGGVDFMKDDIGRRNGKGIILLYIFIIEKYTLLKGGKGYRTYPIILNPFFYS